MNMMAGPPCFKRAIVQVGEARASLHPNLSQGVDRSADTRYSNFVCSTECACLLAYYAGKTQPELLFQAHVAVGLKAVASFDCVLVLFSQLDGLM